MWSCNFGVNRSSSSELQPKSLSGSLSESLCSESHLVWAGIEQFPCNFVNALQMLLMWTGGIGLRQSWTLEALTDHIKSCVLEALAGASSREFDICMLNKQWWFCGSKRQPFCPHSLKCREEFQRRAVWEEQQSPLPWLQREHEAVDSKICRCVPQRQM